MPFLRKYGTGTGADIIIPLIKRGVVDFALSADYVPAAGDVKLNIDGAGAASITTLPTAVTYGNTALWKFTFADAELQGKRIEVTVADSATKAVEDQCFIVETYGNASAKYPTDFSAAVLAVNATQFGGQSVVLDGNNYPGVNVVDWNGVTAPANTGDSYAYLTTNLGLLGANLTGVAAIVWNAVTSGMTTAGSVGKKLANWVLGSDNKAVLSSDETGAGLTNLGDTRIAHLNADITSRMATFSYTTPPTTSQIATALWEDLTAGGDFGTAGSIGKLLVTNIDAATSSRSTLTAGAKMDLIDAPNATAVTAIQSGLATEANATSNRNTLATDITNATNPLATEINAATNKSTILAAVGTPTQEGSYNAAKTAAQAGDAMTLTGAYDAAKSAAAPGAQMDLVNAPNATALTAAANSTNTVLTGAHGSGSWQTGSGGGGGGSDPLTNDPTIYTQGEIGFEIHQTFEKMQGIDTSNVIVQVAPNSPPKPKARTKRIQIFAGDAPAFRSRVVGALGAALTQASFASISYEIFDLNNTASPETPIFSGAITVSSAVYNTLQTPFIDPTWQEDRVGYNFSWRPSVDDFKTTGPGMYRVEVRGESAGGGNGFWVGLWDVEIVETLTVLGSGE